MTAEDALRSGGGCTVLLKLLISFGYPRTAMKVVACTSITKTLRCQMISALPSGTVLMSDHTFLQQFDAMWQGGYFEGDPQDIWGDNTYGVWGCNSAIFTVYMACIRPYVLPQTIALEIGPGRGAWSKAILNCGARHLYVVDAAPPTHTRFWDYVGADAKASYITTRDCSLDGVPDNSIDYFFSFGVFCHLPPHMRVEYIGALAKKMKPAAHGFLQFGDFDKYSECVAHPERYSLLRFLQRQRRKVWLPTRLAYTLSWQLFRKRMDIPAVDKARVDNLTDGSGRGCWHHWATADAERVLRENGFSVVAGDIGVLARDPVAHFQKSAV